MRILSVQKLVLVIFLGMQGWQWTCPATAFGGGQIQVMVDLDPAGSFVIQCKTLEGTAEKTAKGVSARILRIRGNQLETGIDLRNKHMKEKYLETSKFPYIELRDVLGSNGKFKGIAIVKGKKTNVEGTYSTKGSQLDATFSAELSELGIDPPRYLGVGVVNEITIRAEVPLTKKNIGNSIEKKR